MSTIDEDVVAQLRAMARKGESPSRILRELISLLPTNASHKVTLINYTRAACGLTLAQASPIAGWSADDAGEIKDTQLNELVEPGILDNRSQWAID